VHVWEREPLARWNDADLLDTEAKAFTPRGGEIPTGLPMLGGTAGHEVEVLEAWGRLSLGLAGGPLQLAGLSLDPRGEWTARTRNGIELRFGQTAPDGHLAMLNGSVKRTLDGRWDAVQYVDLRYTNGFSVGWTQREEGEKPKPATGRADKPGPKKR
jgi:cell division protein FtsQ